MVDKKITDLQQRSSVTDTVNFPCDDTNQSYRVTALQLLNYILPAGAITAAKLAYNAITGQTLKSAPDLADEILLGSTADTALRRATLAKVSALARSRNYISNGEFRFWQRQAPTTLTSRQDAAFGPDRFYILNSGGAVNIQSARVAETFSASPTPFVGQFRNADATARQFGPVQLIESDRAIGLRGKKVTLSFWARTDGTEVPNIRAGIVEWTGTADSPTRDIVSSWGATPSLISNAAFVNTPADLALTGVMQQFSITVTLGTTFNNLGIFIWTPSTEAQNDDFYLTQIQLVEFAEALPWNHIRKSNAEDLEDCQRYYEKSYIVDQAPSSAVTPGAVYGILPGVVANNFGWGSPVFFKVPKFKSVPTCISYDMAGVANRVELAGVTSASSSPFNEGNGSCGFLNSTGSNQGAANATLKFQWTAEAEI